ncbi:MAG: uridine kinase, partial [Acidobacteria bacterium]
QPFWDLTIFLGGSPDPSARENRRYVEGQQIYLAECDPKAVADLIIDNNNLIAPYLSLRRD